MTETKKVAAISSSDWPFSRSAGGAREEAARPGGLTPGKPEMRKSVSPASCFSIFPDRRFRGAALQRKRAALRFVTSCMPRERLSALVAEYIPMATTVQKITLSPSRDIAVTAGWQATETGGVAGPTQYTTVDKPLAPNSTLGIQMRVTRKTLKQSGDALEQAVRRDMNGAMAQGLSRALPNSVVNA